VRFEKQPIARRSVLAAAVGAMAAFIGRAVDRPQPAAADGETVVVGGTYEDVASATTFGNSLNSAPVLVAWSSSGIGGKFSGGAQAAWGRGRPGIQGESVSPDFPAVVGVNMSSGTGIVGVTNDDIAGGPLINPWSGIIPPARAGIHGVALAAGAHAVRGDTASGHGVHGSASDGIGVYATSSTGTALYVDGPVVFRTAGLTTIRAGAISRLVRPGVDVTSRSKIIATLQSRAGGRTTIHRIYRNPTADTFTIYLTAPATNACTVAWLLLA
jgi:hypothetical protein